MSISDKLWELKPKPHIPRLWEMGGLGMKLKVYQQPFKTVLFKSVRFRLIDGEWHVVSVEHDA